MRARWARRSSQKKIYLRPYQSIQESKRALRSESKASPKNPGKYINRHQNRNASSTTTTTTPAPQPRLQVINHCHAIMHDRVDEKATRVARVCTSEQTRAQIFFFLCLDTWQARRVDGSQTIFCSLACFTILVFVQMRLPQRCGSLRRGRWLSFCLGFWELLVLFRSPQSSRAWLAACGTFSMMAVHERSDGMARRMVFWTGEAEGREIAGCGDLIGD